MYICANTGGIAVSISKELFGLMPGGEEVYIFTVDNGKGLRAEFLNLGCIIRSLVVSVGGCSPTDVVLGRESLEEYLDNEGFFGAVVGRVANRIRNASFELDGVTYNIRANSGKNALHGGIVSYAHKVWESVSADESASSVSFELKSPDGDEGFPGNLDVVVTYTLTDDNSLDIHYEAVSDKDTVVNLTNHSYFNLNGHNSGSVLGHRLWLNSDFYTPSDSDQMPCGEVYSVKGTPFDFTEFKEIGRDIGADDEQLRFGSGYDHNFIINGRGLRCAAQLVGDKSGIRMTTYTDKPGIQIYTANHLKGDRSCKGGCRYDSRGAVCLETQFFPNSTEISHFPSPILKCGEKYDFTTGYAFDAE